MKEEMIVGTLQSTVRRHQARLLAVALLALLGLIAAGCGGSSKSSAPQSGVAGAQHSTSSATVKTRTISGYGAVLVSKQGRSLYIFLKDKHRHVTCKGACLSYWHPLKWKGSGKPKVGGSAKKSLVGWVKASGGKVVTYKHWPLYTYVGDSAAGQTTGEGSTLNGAKWYLMSPKGKAIKHKKSSGGGGGGTTTTGGWG